MQNKFIKILVIGFIVLGLFLIFGKPEWFLGGYHTEFMGIMAFVNAFLIILPRLIFRNPTEESKKKSLDFFQNSLGFILLLNALGAIGLFQFYKFGFGYDKIIHFITPAVSTVAIAYFYYHWYVLPKVEWKKHKLPNQPIIFAMITVIFLGFVWELFEFSSDLFFGSKTFGHYGEFIFEDTILDLMTNTFGVIAGAIILIF